MFLTFALCMTVVMCAVEKNKSTPFSPIAIGFALFATQLAGIQCEWIILGPINLLKYSVGTL